MNARNIKGSTMRDDFSRYFIVASIHAGDALKRAQYFLRLAEQATTEEDRRSLAGAGVILAVAYFSQGVEFRLVQAFANAAAEDGRRPSEAEIQRQLPGGLLARMRLLATVLGDAELRLDERRPSTIRLISAIRLRNRLVHEAGEHVMGSPVDLDCSIVGSVLTLQISVPEDPWEKVSLEMARFVVDASETYFEDLERIAHNEALRKSTFFRRILPWSQ
jgi:hypothetical protein